MVVVGVLGGFQLGVAAGFADEYRAQTEAEDGVGQTEQEWCRAQTVAGGEVAGDHSGDGDRAVAGGLVESHRQAALAGADEVDLHDDGGRPGEALVDAEQHVGEDHPSPRRRPDQQQRNGDGDEPAGDQHGFAAEAVGPGAGEEVGGGLGDAEGDDDRSAGRCSR